MGQQLHRQLTRPQSDETYFHFNCSPRRFVLKDAPQPIWLLSGGKLMTLRTLGADLCRHVLLIAAAAIVPGLVSAESTPNGQNETRLLRSPTVSSTQIAFAYAQNIWV